MTPKSCWTACAALLFMICSPASASSTASVQTGPLIVTLIDLDESNGVAPSVIFEPSSSLNNSYGHVRAGQVDDYRYFDNWSSASLQATSAWVTAAVEMVSAGSPAGSTFAASGSAQDAVNQGDQFFFDAYVKAPDRPAGFTLSANTLMQFSLASDISTATTSPLGPQDRAELAEAFVTLLVTGPGATGIDFQRSFAQHKLRAGYGTSTPNAAGSETIVASFSNQTTGALQGNFSVTTWAWGYSEIAAVPESATALMLLAGLALLGGRRLSV